MLSEALLGLQTYPVNSPSSVWAVWMDTRVALCACKAERSLHG